MSLTGWTLPLSATGRSSTVAPPPWHYSGTMLIVDYSADVEAVAKYVPAGFVPTGAGECSLVACDWASSSDADPRVGEDPELSQYHEMFVVIHGCFADRPAGRVPFIWVDSELSLIRGLIQGYPKQLGSIHITRPVNVGQGGPRLEPNATLRAHASAHGVRLADMTVRLKRPATDEVPTTVLESLIHTRRWPSIDPGRPGVDELTSATLAGAELGTVWTGPAELTMCASSHHELSDLTPLAVHSGWFLSLAFTVTGGTVHTPSREAIA